MISSATAEDAAPLYAVGGRCSQLNAVDNAPDEGSKHWKTAFAKHDVPVGLPIAGVRGGVDISALGDVVGRGRGSFEPRASHVVARKRGLARFSRKDADPKALEIAAANSGVALSLMRSSVACWAPDGSTDSQRI